MRNFNQEKSNYFRIHFMIFRFCTLAQMTTLCQSMIEVMGGTSEQGVFNAVCFTN